MNWLRITTFILVFTTCTKIAAANVGICPANTTDVNIIQMSGIWYYVIGNNFGPDLRCIRAYMKDDNHNLQITKTGRLLSNNEFYNSTEMLDDMGGGWYFMRIGRTGTKYSMNILGTDYSSYLVIAYCAGNRDQHATAIAAEIATRSSTPSNSVLNKAREVLHKYNLSDEHFIEYEQEGCTNKL